MKYCTDCSPWTAVSAEYERCLPIDHPPEIPGGHLAAIGQAKACHDLRIPAPDLFLIAEGADARILSKVRAVPAEVIDSARDLDQVVFMRAHHLPDLPAGALVPASPIRRLKTQEPQAQDMVRSQPHMRNSFMCHGIGCPFRPSQPSSL